jgi:hypothetical protein
MGTNTGIGIGIGIPFKNNALGGDRPYLPPELKARLIGVWDNYGKKNTDADRNIIKNKIPNAGGDLEILNAAYKLNSGFGKYSEDFTTWTKSSKITSVDSESFDFITNANCALLYYKSDIGKDISSFKVRIKLKGKGKVYYNYITLEGVYTTEVITSEEYVTPISYNTKYTGETPVNCGFTIGIISDECSGTITQIPNFEDAFVSDGINDMIVSQKTLQEMGVTKGLTIVSMIHQINTNERNFITTNNLRTANKVVGRNIVSNIDKTGIYGWYKENIEEGNIGVINNILGDKADYIAHDSPNTNTNPITNSKFYVTGYAVENGFIELSSVAYYWTFAVLGKATEDEINLIIGNYNLDRSLKPDILCNIGKQGITNDNHADFNDKLVDYSGNGRDVQMNNLAWKGGSGIAAKPYETFKDWTSESSSTSIITQIDEFTRIVESTTNDYWVSRIRRNSDLNKVYDAINVYLYQDNNFLVHECKYEVDGIKHSIPINESVGKGYHKLEMYTKDRYTELPENAENIVLSEWYFPKSTKGSIKYSVIPSYKGGILLDGVNDFGKVTGMPIYKDYTFIIDYERISYASSKRWVAGVASKSHVANQGAFILMTANTEVEPGKQAYSFGGVTSFNRDDFTRALLYQSKYKCGDVDLTVDEGVDSDTLWLGTFRGNDQRFFNGAIYSLMSFPYSMSEFLIERQLKKHKLGTLYPNMVEFRPVIKHDDRITAIKYYHIKGSSWINLKPGDYIPVGSKISITTNLKSPYTIANVVSSSLTDIKVVPSAGGGNAYDILGYVTDKSPQKITMDIQVDSSLVQWNPVVESNVPYKSVKYYKLVDTSWKAINVGDYVLVGQRILTQITTVGIEDEVVAAVSEQLDIYGINKKPNGEYNILGITSSTTPQKINITIDEYIRYEDIVQPYPVLLRFKDENGNEVSWGGKFKVGSTITRIGSAADSNLLPNIYNIFGLLLNGNQATSSKVIVEKTMVFKVKSAYIFDNNEPKCILSPRLLRIPNSSYKILGYIPDISGHGNHGKINNSAYAEGSGVNEDGSYQFDGVDDFVTIPTTVGGKQVLMKVNWNSLNHVLYDQRNNAEAPFCIVAASGTIAYNQRNVGGNTYIDGILNNHILVDDLQAITHNIVLNNDYNVANSNSFIGTNYTKSIYAKMSLYDFMLFDKISTDDKIKELNEYVGIEAKVELPPYYWDNYGKTNLDADKATIYQRGVAVGDYDLTNYNHAYEGMSGYNGYPVVFGANKTWEISSVYGYISDVTSTTIHVTMAKNAGTGLLFSYVKKDEALTNIKEIPAFRVTVKGLEGNSKFGYRYLATEDATEETLVYLGNGTHELAKSFAPTEALLDLTHNAWVGIFITPMVEGEVVFDCDITIEVLPEYENGLAYDGVEDFSDNKNIPIFTDFTAIIKRIDLDAKNNNSAVMFKGNKIYESSIGNGFILDYHYNSKNYVYSYSKIDQIERDDSKIIYLTPESYNGNPIIKGENGDNLGLILGKYWKGIIYKTILYSKTISLLEINFLKNLMEKDEIIDLTNPIFIKNE